MHARSTRAHGCPHTCTHVHLCRLRTHAHKNMHARTPSGPPWCSAVQVVGLANAYHGDTLGAMDCVPPSPFNGPAQAPWYSGRGLFFEPPYVAMEKGGRGALDGSRDLVCSCTSTLIVRVLSLGSAGCGRPWCALQLGSALPVHLCSHRSRQLVCSEG